MYRRAGTVLCSVTSPKDYHLVRMSVTNCTSSSTMSGRRWSIATGLELSASTVRLPLLRAGLAARVPLRRLPLSK